MHSCGVPFVYHDWTWTNETVKNLLWYLTVTCTEWKTSPEYIQRCCLFVFCLPLPLTPSHSPLLSFYLSLLVSSWYRRRARAHVGRTQQVYLNKRFATEVMHICACTTLIQYTITVIRRNALSIEWEYCVQFNFKHFQSTFRS